MALSGKDTAGSQWYVTLSPQPHLDGQYTVFGQVTQGMQVLRSMLPSDRIERITIERVPTQAQRIAGEKVLAKRTRVELAKRVKPRVKSSRAQRLLAEHYGQKPIEEKPPPAPKPGQVEGKPEQVEGKPKDPKDQGEPQDKPLDDKPDDLPDQHQQEEKEKPLNQGEKIEFDVDEEEGG